MFGSTFDNETRTVTTDTAFSIRRIEWAMARVRNRKVDHSRDRCVGLVDVRHGALTRLLVEPVPTDPQDGLILALHHDGFDRV
jgi:hypothetical protein